MVQQTISFQHRRVSIYLTGIDRLWWRTPFLPQRFTITHPLEVESRCVPAALTDVIHETVGRRIIHNVRHEVREGPDAEAALNEVAS